MSKTVNATFTVTRDGVANPVVLKGITYGKLVTLEAALATAQQNLVVWGVGRLAELKGYSPSTAGAARTADISVRLEADFGASSSEFSAAWRGLSASDADQIQQLILTATAQALA